MAVFYKTQKYLKKNFNEETINNYGNVLAYLYQNGFEMNCPDDEVEDQLSLFNYFKTEEDLDDLRKTYNYLESDYEIGKKIVSEELLEIVKNATFCRKELDNPTLIKSNATVNWQKIINCTNRVNELLVCNDTEIKEVIKDYPEIKKKTDNVISYIEKDKKVQTWMSFVSLINIVFSTHIQLKKTKTDVHKLTIASNFNDEIYGATGGYNPLNGEIKCIIGSAVWDCKSCKNGNKNKLKTKAKEILESPKTEEDENIEFLQRWYNGHETDDEFARKVILGCLLNGVLSLLSLKHNINLIETDDRNSKRGDEVITEFKAILKYCGITKDYLL